MTQMSKSLVEALNGTFQKTQGMEKSLRSAQRDIPKEKGSKLSNKNRALEILIESCILQTLIQILKEEVKTSSSLEICYLISIAKFIFYSSETNPSFSSSLKIGLIWI